MNTPRDDATTTLLPNGQVLVAGGYNGSGFLSSAELYNPATGIWSVTGTLNTPRAYATATLLPNGQVLVAGGYNASDYLSSAELYNPATGIWSVTGSLNTPRYDATATLLPNGLVLVAGGYLGGDLTSAELYNPATGVWSTTGSLNFGRYDATATLLPNGQVLVASGYNDLSGYLSSAELYNPATGIWSVTGRLNTPRDLATATLLPNGQVLVAGGYNGLSYLSSAELYNPATGIWSVTGSLNTSRDHATATLLPNGQVLLADGYNGSYLSGAELYNPATGVWSTTGSLNFGHYDATATLLPNGQVLVAGGDNGSGYLSSAELYNPATGQWSFGPRDNAMVTVLPNGLVLVAGGYNGSAYLSSAELYNPATGVWSATGSLNTPRYDATATLLPNGQVLVADGYNYSYLSSAELYNPATGVWSVTGSLNTPRDQATATLLPNGLVLVAGGYNGSYLSSPELYNPATGEWDNGFLSPRDLATATLLASGLVLVAGGYDGSGYLSSAVLYNPATGVWLPTGSLNTPRDLATATLLPSGLVLVAGGNNGYFAQSSAELYNPATGVWSYTGSLNTPRYDATATLLPNGQVLVAGGYNGGLWLSNAELYNPATGVWSATGALNTPRDGDTATLLPNGLVLVAGGNNGYFAQASAELYNPATGVWSYTGSLNTPRYDATATLLPNGLVLVAGGYNGSFWLSNAELYNPATGVWSLTGSLNVPRDLATATLLPNGQVLVTGGFNNSSGQLSSAELYNPATGVWSLTSSLNTARDHATATLLPNGQVLVVGGFNGSSYLSNAELYASPILQAITVTSTNSSVLVGTTDQFTATGAYSDGSTQDLTSQVTWTSGTASVAIITPATGLAAGVAGGASAITASLNGLTSAPYVLTVKTLKSIAVTPQQPSVTPTAIATLVAMRPESQVNVPNNANGFFPAPAVSGLHSSGANIAVSWSGQLNINQAGTYTFFSTSDDGSLLYVDGSVVVNNDGVHGFQDGTSAAIFLSAGYHSFLELYIQGIYGAGVQVSYAGPDTPSGSEEVVPASAFPQQLTASYYNLSSQPSNVEAAFNLSPATVAVGGTRQLTATATYSDGSIQNITAQVAWASPTTSDAIITPATGLAAGVAPGTSLITASLNGLTSPPLVLTVAAPTLQSIAVSAANPSVVAGFRDRFTAMGTYSDGSTTNLTSQVTWYSAMTSVASISTAGVATGLAQGASTITASLNGLTSPPLVLTVAAPTPTLTTIAVTPTNPYLWARLSGLRTVQFTAMGTYSDGSTQNITTQVTWNSATTSVAYIPPSGLATALSPGTSSITASLNGISSPADVLTVDGTVPSASYPLPAFATATLLPNGLVLVAGGYNGYYLSSAELYNPATNTWSVTGSLNTARAYDTATLLPNGQVLVAGGYNGSTYLSTAELYNPATGDWTATGSLNTPRYEATATLLPNGLVLVAGGYYNAYLSSAELYNPATGIWSVTGSLNTPRRLAAATLLPNGLVLVADGDTNPGNSSAELYNPATGVWSVTGSLHFARIYATATLLPNGQVLVAGGYNGSYLSSAELYNPATGIWSVTGSLNTPRDDATATLLPNGLVLVAYGYNGSSLSSAELYNPATGIWSFAGSLNLLREDATATLLPNGTVLSAGGYYSYSGVFYPVNDSEVYYYTGLPTLLTIAVTPASPNLPIGLTQQLTATGTYSDGTTQNLTSQVTWASATSSVATVSPTGLATGVAQGTSLITASLGGVVTTTADSLTVTAPTLQTITVSPATPILAMGLTQQFTATGTYSDGTTQNLTSQVTWASAISSVANISVTGLATAVGVGTSAITASFAGVTNAPLLLVVTAVGSLTNTWAPAGAGNGTVGSTATLLPNGLVLEAGGFAGGFDGSNLVSSAELYNPATDIWSVTGSLNTPRAYATATLLPNGLVLVAGGVSNGSELSSAELYNPATGAWSYTGSLNTGRAYATTTLLPNGQVLVAGGYYGSGYLASAELYNPATGIWSYTGNLNTGRDDATATLLPNGQVLVAGGENGSAYLASGYLSSAELYNPATGIWSFTGSLNFARSNDTATLLPNGQVLVAGGYNGSADLPTTELYNPTTGVWSGTGYLNTPRDLATATLLTNGQVLVAGGDYDAGSGGFSLSSAELYNPATGVWSVTGTLNQPRENATATLLPDGQVLVAGGDNVAVSGVSWVGASEVYGRSLLSLAVTTVGPPTVWAPFISSTGLIESQDEALNPRQFIATGTFSDGTTVDLTGAVTWQSSNSAVAAILPPGDYRIPPTSANSSPSGWVLGVAAGTSSITASYDGVSSTPDVLTVQGSILQSITVTPGNAIIATGSTQQFTATGVFSDGTTQNLSAYGLPWIPGPQLPEAMTWTSGTSSVATISSTGLATGLTTGTSTITLVYSVNGTIYSVPALLTVAPPILQSITVTPANPAIAQGLTQQFTATGTYSDGSTQDLTSQVTWASGTSSVVTISSAGLATGVAAGTSSITASLNGVAANTAVTVKTLQSISVAPANSGTPTVTLGGTLQFTATGRCIDGSTENLTSQVTWAVVPPVAAAVVSPTGLVAGVGQGTSTIMASLNGLTATSVVTVITLQSITVTPANSAIPTVALGGTQQFTATGTYSDGSTQNLTSQVSWSVVPSIVATISSTGLATGQFANAAVIRAVLGGVEGDSSLVVTGLSPAVGNTPSVTTDFARGGTAFAQDVQPGYSIAAVNDGIYGSASSWIGTSVSDFVGISFGTTLTTLCGVAWSRDNTGVNTDRSLGTYTLQYTTVANPSASTPASAWTTIGSVTYTSATWLQHVYAFNPVQVTGIRLETQSASASNLIAIDELSLYAQSPVFTASDGSVYVLGTSGNDNIYVAASRTTAGAVIPNSVTVTLNTTGTWGPYATNGKPVTVFGYAGDDTIAVDPAFTGPTNLFGGDGNDTLTGGGGNDYIDGGAGTNYEVPSAGNDTIVNASGVVVHGDPGNNAISFSWHPGADPSRDILVESINGRTYSMDYTPADNAPNLTIEVVGGSGNNTLVMGPDPAGKWNTVFIGGPKTNILVAGPNNPSALLVGGSGTNILVGGGGKETIEGGSGVNTIYGGTGTDTIIAGTGKTTIIGGTGHMTIENFTALDTLTPGKGSYTVAPGSLPASGRGAGIDAFVAMVYSEELGRVDDPAGLQYWARRLSARLRPLAVVTDIADSPEHLARLAAGAVSHLSASRVDDDALAAARRARGHLFASNSIPRGPLSSRTLSRQAPAKTRPSPRDALSQAASRTRRSIVPIDRILGV